MSEITQAASVAKYVFRVRGETLTPAHVLVASDDKVHGIPQQTGLIVRSSNGTRIQTIVRSPNWIPVANHTDGTTEFGGLQTTAHIEYNHGEQMGAERASEIATAVVENAKKGIGPRVGVESEAWVHNPNNGTLQPLPKEQQIELQRALLEQPLAPCNSIEALACLRAQDILERPNKTHGTYTVDTSTPIAGSMQDKGILQNNGEGEPYVQATASKLRSRMTSPDRYARQLADTIAKHNGYSDFNHMRDSLTHIGYWTAAAGHESVELPHVKDVDTGDNRVPLEIGIAVADLFNSDFATIAEWLTYSTPMVLGVPAVVSDQHGEKKHLMDARATLRYIMTTSYPSPFIETVSELQRRWDKAIGSGEVATADRASYIALHPDETNTKTVESAAIHARVRLRLATNDTKNNQVGRVEFTGRGSTPSLIDEMASDAFVRLLAISAHEAVAHGQHPKEYFKRKYPHMTSWEHQRDLAHAYNMYGTQDKRVQIILRECDAYLTDMENEYPGLRHDVELVRQRVRNLMERPVAENLTEYLQNPKGPISKVIQRMVTEGQTPTQILRAVYEYQQALAEQVLQANGNVLSVLGVKTRR